MFAKACEKAMRFTHPLVNNIRTIDGTVTTTFGSYFFINKDGWAVSCAHVFNPMMQARYDADHIKEIRDKQMKDQAEGRESNAVMNPSWITNHSLWFGADTIRLNTVKFIAPFDIAIFKLDNVPEGFIQDVAVLGNIENLKVGTSLCKLGYSFINVETKFDNNQFRMPNLNTIPPFPLEGMFTRFATEVIDMPQNKKVPIRYVETSTPGVKGQSGGPTFDVNGVVYAIQSKTRHMPLGFMPKVEENGETVTMHQFLNVGNGIPVDYLIKALIDNKISFESEDKEEDGSVYIIR